MSFELNKTFGSSEGEELASPALQDPVIQPTNQRFAKTPKKIPTSGTVCCCPCQVPIG